MQIEVAGVDDTPPCKQPWKLLASIDFLVPQVKLIYMTDEIVFWPIVFGEEVCNR